MLERSGHDLALDLTRSPRRGPPAIAVAAALLATSGCAGAPDDPSPTATEHEEALTANALTVNALTANALTVNALTADALTAHALTAHALTTHALTADALANDPSARVVLKYIIGCALPEGTHLDLEIDGATYGYDGSIGLAPEWGKPNGHCNANCRGWVSGCVLARLNYLGETVPISIRGNHSALGSTPAERHDYPNREATYFGDIFRPNQIRLGCLPPGATSDERVCGPSLEGCAITFGASCEKACDGAKDDGSFPDCHNHGRNSHGFFPPGTAAFKGSVTVFLQ